MKKIIIDYFKLKKSKHSNLKEFGYEFVFQKRGGVKNSTALMYSLVDIELWAREQQKILEDFLTQPD